MELLAPAGNFENFHAAFDAGADAVYAGAPGLNARNPVRDLRLDEIGAMIQMVRERSKKIYIALNSLVRERDLPELISILSYFEQIRPDGLIVQDLGVINLVREHFPDLELHGSTLMTAHNSLCAEIFGSMGMTRVVAAREMTLKELRVLVKKSPIDIEVFVHGAMCFSYSGLCLFSSYLGGKSGLRGNCVQPCRRKYTISGGTGAGRSKGPSGGYCFSMNDLSGIEMVPELRKMGVASLKIEGRLRSATYVRNVVGAYRMVIDSGSEPSGKVLAEASEMIEEAMGRKTSTGYFLSPQPRDSIISHHSGNIGKYLGRVEQVEKRGEKLVAMLKLKHGCSAGDRLRVHLENGDKRIPFRLRSLWLDSEECRNADKGQKVGIVLPPEIKHTEATGKVEIFCVDVQSRLEPFTKRETRLELPPKTKRLIDRKAQLLTELVSVPFKGENKPPQGQVAGKRRGGRKNRTELWFKFDNARAIFEKLQVTPDKYLISLDKNNISLAGQMKKYLGRNMRSVIWALPPVITENNLNQVRKNISILIRTGFRSFQVSHSSQILLFENERIQLYGDYTLNLLNSQAMKLVSLMDFRGAQISIETDRQSLQSALAGYRFRKTDTASGITEPSIQVGMTVYGVPPLFISRIASGQLVYGKNLVSPKKELFVIEKKEGYSLTRPRKPFSLLPYRAEIEGFGVNYLVIDLSGMKAPGKDLADVYERLSGRGKGVKLPTFNYLGTLG